MMRSLLLVAYHLCLRALAILGLPFLVIFSHQTGQLVLQGGADDVWPRLILICGVAPLCLFFAVPNLLPQRVQRPNLRELGPFLFVGLGFSGFAVMNLAQAAISGLSLPDATLDILTKAGGALALLLSGSAGVLALTLSNQAVDQSEARHGQPHRRAPQKQRPSTEELRALRHARMERTSL